MRWADTDSDDSDDEFQTHPSRSGSAMGNLIVNHPQVRESIIYLLSKSPPPPPPGSKKLRSTLSFVMPFLFASSLVAYS